MSYKQLPVYVVIFGFAVLAISLSLVIIKILVNLLLLLIGIALTAVFWVLYGKKKNVHRRFFTRYY